MSLEHLMTSLFGMKSIEISEGHLERHLLEKTRLPDGCEYIKVKLEQVFKRRARHHHYISLFGTKSTSIHTISALLHEIIEECLKIRRPFGFFSYKVKTEASWALEDFLQEKDIFDFTEMEVETSYSDNSEDTILEKKLRNHSVNAYSLNGYLEICARGEYRSLVPNIMETLKPEEVELLLDPDDARHIAAKAKGRLGPLIEEQLKPQETLEFNFHSFLTGISPDFSEVISVPVNATAIPLLEELIAKPIIRGTMSKSRITLMRKKLIDPLTDLKNVQQLVRVIQSFKPDFIFNQPTVSLEVAKMQLDKEIASVKKSFSNLIFDQNTHIKRGVAVEVLARNYFGNDFKKITAPMDTMAPEEYLEFLKSQGFDCPADIHRRELPEHLSTKHIKEIEDIRYALSDNTINQWYLFSFFIDCFKKNPRDMVEISRNASISLPPRVIIKGKASNFQDRVKKPRLPSKATLSSISYETQPMFPFTKENNRLMIELNTISIKPELTLYFFIDSKKPRLIKLQEIALKKLGFTFD
jgi:hypothetical protein